MSKSDTALLSQTDVLRQKGMIGIIGFNDPIAVAILNREIIKYGNTIGLIDDQHFPEILAVGMRCENTQQFFDQAKLCVDFGCDVLVFAEVVGASKLDEQVEQIHNAGMSMMSLQDGESIEQLAQKVLQRSLKVKKPRRPDIIFKSDQDWRDQVQVVQENLDQDLNDRKQRFQERYSYGYTRGGGQLFMHKKVGVIGGAGPLTSASLCEGLAKDAVPFVHYSVNSAPGKHYFEMGQGPSYIPYYKNAVNFFEDIEVSRLVIPCNTAHARLSEFCGDSFSKVSDIRKAVLTQIKGSNKAILLGTSRTTGIGLPSESEVGIYEKMRRDVTSGRKMEFILPSLEQQQVTMSAIYDVKAGRFDEAKGKIDQVIREKRAEYEDRTLPVIFACTELALANYVPSELKTNNIIDPAEMLIKMVKQALDEDRAIEISSAPRVLKILQRHGLDISSDSSCDEMPVKESENYKPNKMKLYVENSREGVTTYRLVIEGEDTVKKVQKMRYLGGLKDRFYSDESGEIQKGGSYHLSAVHGNYVSFHNPDSEVLARIEKFAEENEIERQNGVPQQKSNRR